MWNYYTGTGPILDWYLLEEKCVAMGWMMNVIIFCQIDIQFSEGLNNILLINNFDLINYSWSLNKLNSRFTKGFKVQRKRSPLIPATWSGPQGRPGASLDGRSPNGSTETYNICLPRRNIKVWCSSSIFRKFSDWWSNGRKYLWLVNSLFCFGLNFDRWGLVKLIKNFTKFHNFPSENKMRRSHVLNN